MSTTEPANLWNPCAEQRQADFAKVWDWFIVKRNKPGIRRMRNSNGRTSLLCVYRGFRTADCRCAIGVLLTNEQIKRMGGHDASVVTEIDDSLLPVFVVRDLDFYARLQDAHDSVARRTTPLGFGINKKFASEFEDRLRSFAVSYGLTVPDARASA